jgi:hypothetical protein
MSTISSSTKRTGLVNINDNESDQGLILVIIITGSLLLIFFVIGGVIFYYYFSNKTHIRDVHSSERYMDRPFTSVE